MIAFIRRHSAGNNPRLATRLLVALLAVLLAVLVLATIAAAVTAYLESSDIQDETLLSVARLVETNQIAVQHDKSFYKDNDYDDGVLVWQVGSENRGGLPIKKSISNGYHTISAKGEFWRVYVTKNQQSQQRFAIVQNLGVKTELARSSAMNTALPLLGLFLLVPLLTVLVIRHSFKPLNQLGQKVSSSESLQLGFDSREKIPEEVLPFVSSIDALLQKNTDYNLKQRRFIADAAHELRTPITALSLEVDNLQHSQSDSVRQAREASLKSSIGRLHRLVNQLLDLARAQSVVSEAVKSVHVNELLKTQIADLFLLAEEKNIELVVVHNEDLYVNDTNNQLQHLLRNALSNAIKFSPPSGLVTIELRQQGNSAIFSVTDTGPGVENEHLQKLHEPFYRPAEQATGTGDGLGLAICHEIAQKLGGQLTLDNADGGGFRFQYAQSLVAKSGKPVKRIDA